MKPTLTYFKEFRGRGEAARLALHLAGIEFQDKRISMEEFAKIKSTMPFGQLPFFEDGNVSLCQSQAIVFYICDKGRMVPETYAATATAMMIVGCCEDISLNMAKLFRTPDAEKPKLIKSLQTETMPLQLANLEKLVKKTGNGKYAVGDSCTYADIMVASLVEILLFENMPFSPKTASLAAADKYPTLLKIHSKLYNSRHVAAWAKTQRG